MKIPNVSTLVGLCYATMVATHTTMRGALMYLNEILPGNWREDEWPEHIEVSHEASRFKSRQVRAARELRQQVLGQPGRWHLVLALRLGRCHRAGHDRFG